MSAIKSELDFSKGLLEYGKKKLTQEDISKLVEGYKGIFDSLKLAFTPENVSAYYEGYKYHLSQMVGTGAIPDHNSENYQESLRQLIGLTVCIDRLINPLK